MSMITGCPACGTLFKVVPDQLKISTGSVRCGHCGEVFDATAHMHEAAAEPPPDAVVAAPPAPTTAPLPVTMLGDSVLPPEAAQDQEEPPATQPEQPQHAATFLSRPDAGPSYPPIDFVRSEMEASAAPLGDFGIAREDDDDEDAAIEQASFVQQARRQAYWRRPLIRALLVLAVLALAALLAGQVVIHERDRLAARHPQWRAALAQACARLGCSVGPLRRIDAILIDSSGFTKLRPDTYRLSFTLKNQAAVPVAVPALELTLTDTQDQPLLRRVLTPAELGAPAATLPAGGDWSGAVALAATAPGYTGRIAGYRLLAFYP